MASVEKNPTEVEMNKYVFVDSVQRKRNQAFLAGQLLKAMDTVACLSAEKHAKMPCVTLTMDDLEVNETSQSLGQVLNIKARLTRAFSSSMEVLVEVALEDILQSKTNNICQAFFTFVATSKSGKANLQHLDPVSMNDRLQYALANERRKMRFAIRKEANSKQDNQDKVTEDSIPPQSHTCIDGPTMMSKPHQLTMNQTGVESIELVLPSHANHHQTTFGGQIMAWLVSVCIISASRLCHNVPSLIAVNGIQFYGPSSVGDRLVFKAMVNKTFDDNSMEVGCRVEAWSVDGESRHINSAYLIFVDFDEHGRRKSLPNVTPMTKDEHQHQTNAANRCQFQMEKKKILESVGPALSVPWSQANSSILALNNVSAFRKLCHLNNWEEVSKEAETVLFKCTQDDLMCVKVEAIFPTSAHDVFNCLNNINDRAAWDPIFTESKTVKEIDDDDKIVRFVMATTTDESTQPDDMLVLQSSRAALRENDDYVIAYRSIILESSPALEGYSRKENLSSGFLIQGLKNDQSKSSLIYINQITAQVAAYLFSDLTGKTKMYVNRIGKLQDFIAEKLKH